MDDLRRTHVSLKHLQANLSSLNQLISEQPADKETLRHIREALAELDAEITLIKYVITEK